MKSWYKKILGGPTDLGGLHLPFVNLVARIKNLYPFVDRIGKHDGPAQLRQFAEVTAGTVTLYHPNITGSETIVSSGGTASVSVVAGAIVIGVGTCWEIRDSAGHYWAYCAALSPTSAVMWDVSEKRDHLVAEGLTEAVVTALCSSGRDLMVGTDWLDRGYTVADSNYDFFDSEVFGAIPDNIVIPAIESAANSVAYQCDVPRMLLVGTSIAEASASAFYAPTPRALAAAKTIAGATQISVNAGGVAAISLTVGDYFVVSTHGGGAERKLVTSISGDTINFTPPLVRQVFASAHVCKSTSASSFLPAYQDTYSGYIRSVNSMLDNPFNIVQPGIAFGGEKVAFIAPFLDDALEKYRPQVVWINMFENDVAYTPLADLLAAGRLVVEKCLAFGAVPVICPSLPANFTVDKIPVFDGLVEWCAQVGDEYPGAIGVNPGAVYTITTNPTYPRTFAPGWTGGDIHPVVASSYKIALSIFDAVKNTLESLSSTVDLISSNRYLTGSGGTAANIQVAGRAIPDNCQAFANAAHTVYITKTADNICKFDFSAVTAVLGTYSWLKIPIPLPVRVGVPIFFSARLRIEMLSHFGISDIYIKITDQNNAIVSQKLNYGLLDPDELLSGRVLTFDTAPVQLYSGIASLTMQVFITPRTVSNATASFLIKEAGVYFVKDGSAI